MNYWFGDSAKVIHVSKSGNDSNGGVAQQYPVSLANDSKLTIGSALSACPDGGTIVVWPGTYDEIADIETAGKQITLAATHRGKCIITNATTGATVFMNEGCTLQNITVINTNAIGKAVDGYQKDNCSYINCDIICETGMDGLYLADAWDCFVKRCFIKNGYDVLYGGPHLLVEDSIIVATGLSSGSGDSVCVRLAGAAQKYNVIIRNSFLIAQPSYRKATGKEPELYESDRNLYCLKTIGAAMLENCSLIADGSKPAAAHASSYAAGHAYCVSGISQLSAYNCQFYAATDANQSATIARCIYGGSAQIYNSGFAAEGTQASYEMDGGMLYLCNTRYDSSKVNNATLRTMPDDNGGVNATGKALTAAKMIANKAVQNKITGAIDYYDDDGQTVLLTHTPSDTQSETTRTPS